MAQNTTLRITGMTCDHCARTIEKALNALPGVTARVSFPDAQAKVELREALPVERLLNAVRAKGYGAESLGPESIPPAHTGGESGLRVVIIGSGSAAFACALRAASEGAQVTMIEQGTLGGTCVNIGCVPSKIMIRAAHVAHQMEHHPFNGLGKATAVLERRRLVAQQQARVDELRQAKYQHNLDDNPNINLLQGQARFTAPTALSVKRPDGSETHVQADRVLIATGASPAVPSIPGLRDTPYWTSTEALVAEDLPEHLIVLGGSAVGLELAQAFLRLGSKVSVIELLPRLLPREDEALGAELATFLEGEGLRILTGITTKSVHHSGSQFGVDIGSELITGDRLLVATGRRPNTAGLGLDAIGVKIERNGAIIVDDHLRTSIEQVYAAGDCTRHPQFVYVAAAGGTRAAINMLGGDATLDLSTMPAVVFTDPQVATVGLTEAAAGEQGLAVDSRTLTLDNVPRALANFETQGFIKLVAETTGGRLLGAQILAPEAGEIIEIAALAIRQHMTVQQLADTMFPYLVMAEGLKLCAQTFSMDVTKLSCCAG
ncbi:MAG: mercury(II) reductase [Gammaproteobacteria bacterium]|nr:mercury(II) reductase [Gammaproteobacteria bacterium]MDE1886852.1 mercury(II) reductase [Gammaproteobacteria bacterium]MDE2023401.1 mercury(II) reductase [Gammaproteobacteria bacterium]MDE2138882.1 mercury(II) reductase [Gammaproteobacteria bacterium]MDE2274533.1 mercury(II) reductase [Gammaproteobacteria bacterium]